jgi:hypothetical protein
MITFPVAYNDGNQNPSASPLARDERAGMMTHGEAKVSAFSATINNGVRTGKENRQTDLPCLL